MAPFSKCLYPLYIIRYRILKCIIKLLISYFNLCLYRLIFYDQLFITFVLFEIQNHTNNNIPICTIGKIHYQLFGNSQPSSQQLENSIHVLILHENKNENLQIRQDIRSCQSIKIVSAIITQIHKARMISKKIYRYRLEKKYTDFNVSRNCSIKLIFFKSNRDPWDFVTIRTNA